MVQVAVKTCVYDERPVDATGPAQAARGPRIVIGPRQLGVCPATGRRKSGVKRGLLIASALATISLATAGRASAEDYYEFRFAFDTMCG